MKKLHVLLIAAIVILIIVNLLILTKPKNVLSVNGRKFTERDINIQRELICIIDGIEDYSPENAAFDIIRQQYFVELCRIKGIPVNSSVLDNFTNNLASYGDNANTLDEVKSYLGKGYNERFLIPYYCNNAFIEHILSDTLDLQKDRYEYSISALSGWTDDDYDPWLNDYCEYIEYSSEEDNNTSPENTLTEDMSYYYIMRNINGKLCGLRIQKHSADSIIANFPADIDIKFYNESYMRGVQKISAETYWYNLIFRE